MHNIKNYRPLSINSIPAKVFAKIIINRIKNTLELEQPKEQAGFRSNYSTIDHLFVINQLIEKCSEHNRKVYLAFIDYTKAFDSVKHNSMMEALKKQGVQKIYIQIINEMYSKTKARVKTDRIGETFSVKKGVKQGDPLSAIIFNCVLEDVFRELDWDKKGININGEYLSNLRYADDVVLVASTKKELNEMMQDLNEKGKV